MKPIGRGTKWSGKYTGLGIAQQFANAVLHFLREHASATRREDGGIELPIDEPTWRKVLDIEYGPKYGQSLQAYCSYYNGGRHGLGYDQDGRVDFGTGKRPGQSINGTEKAVHRGSQWYLKPMDVIAIVRGRLSEIPRKDGLAVGDLLEPQWQRLEQQGHFDPTDDLEARRRILAAIVQRYGREQFRAELLEAYGRRCAVTGCNAQWALEAAHIKRYNGPKTDYVSNGLLLRGDIHTLYDLNLLGIEPDSWKIDLAPCLLGSSYEKYNGRVLRKPRCESKRPDKQAVTQRWKEFQKAVGDSHG